MSIVYAKIYLATKRRLRDELRRLLAQKPRSQRHAQNQIQTTHFSNSPAVSRYCASEKPSSDHDQAALVSIGGGKAVTQLGTSSTMKSSPSQAISPSQPPTTLKILPSGGTISSSIIPPKLSFDPPRFKRIVDSSSSSIVSSGTEAEVSCYVSGDSADLPPLQSSTNKSANQNESETKPTQPKSLPLNQLVHVVQVTCTCAPQQGGYQLKEEVEENEVDQRRRRQYCTGF